MCLCVRSCESAMRPQRSRVIEAAEDSISVVPAIRIHAASPAPARRKGRYVLYWMTSSRRTRFNYGLQRAIAWCSELDLPLVVLEALRLEYPYASERFHRFVIDGMHDNEAAFAQAGVTYLPFVERKAGEGKGLVELLAEEAALVVTDEFPAFFLPRMHAALAERLRARDIRMEQVDSNGLVPLRASKTPFAFAHQFRRFVQKTLPALLDQAPLATPLAHYKPMPVKLPEALASRFVFATHEELAAPDAWLSGLAIDHSVKAVEERGGSVAGEARMHAFVKRKLSRYHEDRSHPDDDVASGLSFWLHFGHVSPHAVWEAVMEQASWSKEKIAAKVTGSREGFWNASDAADSFIDELVTWRELGLQRCHHTDDFDRYEGLPAWSRKSLEEHLGDARSGLYTRDQLEAGKTDDAVWNAAMRELRETGRIQNYLRMVWGKKTLEWFAHPREAFDALVYLNDKYAVDGRDPNGYTNIGWVFGAYDRAWGPERKIFGKVRYMTSSATVKKLRMKSWLAQWGAGKIRAFDFDA